MDDGHAAPAKSRSTGKERHRLDGGPRLQAGVDGIRFYTIGCECGWESGRCNSAVLAEAEGEQHQTMSSISRAGASRRAASATSGDSGVTTR